MREVEFKGKVAVVTGAASGMGLLAGRIAIGPLNPDTSGFIIYVR